MKRWFPVFLTLTLMFLASGCGNRRPANVPDKEEMAEMLFEIHTMESMVRCSYIHNLREKSYIYNNILKAHNLTPEGFDSCIYWYGNNKEEYLKVYEIVQAKIKEEIVAIQDGKYKVEVAEEMEKPLLIKSITPREDVFSSLNRQPLLLPLRLETLTSPSPEDMTE